MTNSSIYSDIMTRTGGDIYIGVVGPVRTGKSTFIKKFMESLVLPNIADSGERERARDEIPQSAAGKTVMTTEPKFVPDEAVEIVLDGNAALRVKMIDCVGYVIPGAMGHTEGEAPRMVMTPWSEEEMPFDKAAETGTSKVIKDHSTIGILVTTDGSIGEIPRENYVNAERRVVSELKEINKPFAIILNSAVPESEAATELALSLEDEYGVPVALVNCTDITEEDIKKILELVLLEFPVREIGINIPAWIDALPSEHSLRKNLYASISDSADKITKVGQAREAFSTVSCGEYGISLYPDAIDLASGRVHLAASIPDGLFYRILGEETGFTIGGEEDLMINLRNLSKVKKEYDKLEKALNDVHENGYGIVTPMPEDMTLEEPELVKQQGGYGVRLRASAPSIHIVRRKQKSNVNGAEQGLFKHRVFTLCAFCIHIHF